MHIRKQRRQKTIYESKKNEELQIKREMINNKTKQKSKQSSKGFH